MNILMIEDNESVGEMLQMFFEKEEWDVTFVHDGQEGLDTYLENQTDYDLLILDIMLPTIDGITIAREIRNVDKKVPIIMLTAKDSESDEVIGLEIGADDYVTKPFSPITLVARIKSTVRRMEVPGANKVSESSHNIETENLSINKNTREIILYGEPLEDLTPKEFDLLSTLADSPRRVFSRKQLLERVWEYEYFGDERTVDAHIKKLRQKLLRNGPQVIQTVWGVGYKFDDTGDFE